MTGHLCWSSPIATFPLHLPRSARSHQEREDRENMKRRNGAAEGGKRRPVKRTKLTDNIFGRWVVIIIMSIILILITGLAWTCSCELVGTAKAEAS